MIDELLAFTHELLDETDALAMRLFTAGVTPTVKPNRTLVTRADTEVEERIRERIAARWPGHGVLGEELGADDAYADIAWIVDPIDATHNFVRGIGVWATLVACRIGPDLVLGAVSAPAMGERWWATVEGGAWRREARADRRIGVSQVPALGKEQLI
jgi:histidinol-phosphatase